MIGTYENKFQQLAALQKEIGLTPKTGLYGDLRKAVHSVESTAKEVGADAVLVPMLQLRRNEKDFMLRKDTKYLDKFSGNLEKTRNVINSIEIEDGMKTKLMAGLDQYHTNFTALIKKEQEKGLTSKQGVLGEMRKTIHQSETILQELSEGISVESHEHIESFVTMAIGQFILATLVLVASLFYISRSTIRSVEGLRNIMNEVEQTRDLTLRAEASGKDEITEMSNAFNNMMVEFQQLVSEVSDSAVQVSSAAEELSAITVQTSKGMQQQEDEMNQVATAINEMEATMNDVARNTEEAANEAQHSRDEADNIKMIITSTIDEIQNLAAMTEKSADSAKQLEAESIKYWNRFRCDQICC